MSPSIKLNEELVSTLIEAYRPCANFGVCREAVWVPECGHIPRGFLGATRDLADVEVVMVFAEPGHPHPSESYDPSCIPLELLYSGHRYAYECHKNGADLFHRNVRWFLSRLWPDLEFEEQLQHVWLTEGRLCSIANEIGSTTDRTCSSTFLKQQLDLLPNATVVAFGGKARHYVRGLGVNALEAYALAPPGANHKPAKPSWERAIEYIVAKRARSPR